MSTSRTISIVLMIVGLVVCYFLLGSGITLWLVVAFLAAYGLIFLAYLAHQGPVMHILTFFIGIGLFWWLLGWQAALAFLLLSCAFAFVQPGAG